MCLYASALITEYGQYRPSYGEIEVELIFDTEHDHYQLIKVGWHNDEWIHGCFLHQQSMGLISLVLIF